MDIERLVAGRERIYLDRFWNEFSATPSRLSDDARNHYARLCATPRAIIPDSCSLPHLTSCRRQQELSFQR